MTSKELELYNGVNDQLRTHITDWLSQGADPDNLSFILLGATVGMLMAVSDEQLNEHQYQQAVMDLYAQVQAHFEIKPEVH